MSFEYLIERLRKVVGIDGRQKAQFPEIHSKHWELAIAHLFGGSQNRTISTEDDSEIGVDRVQVDLELEVGQQQFGTLGQDRLQVERVLFDFFTISSAEQDGAELF
jgi:hypothetical protein